jgi:hypothetical protein
MIVDNDVNKIRSIEMATIQCACCHKVMGVIAPGKLDSLITVITHSICLSCCFSLSIDVHPTAINSREMKDEQSISVVPDIDCIQ